jgi:hypothetical protein
MIMDPFQKKGVVVLSNLSSVEEVFVGVKNTGFGLMQSL